MKHRCGHPKAGKYCKVCNKAQGKRAYARLQQGVQVWRELATKPWLSYV